MVVLFLIDTIISRFLLRKSREHPTSCQKKDRLQIRRSIGLPERTTIFVCLPPSTFAIAVVIDDQYHVCRPLPLPAYILCLSPLVSVSLCTPYRFISRRPASVLFYSVCISQQHFVHHRTLCSWEGGGGPPDQRHRRCGRRCVHAVGMDSPSQS